jgi:hypothetical protein
MMHDMDDKTLKWFCMISLQRRVLYSQTPFIWSSRTAKITSTGGITMVLFWGWGHLTGKKHKGTFLNDGIF